ncbi:MAG: D-aminoacyl-tRNA deacylase [Sedimentisphaerales bacterium]|nr:D-aminoacyl-tRNA deacylase [Sedimentisphaerales bacterium]
MRALVQTVSSAWVAVNGREVSKIGRGLLVYLGIGKADGLEDASYIAQKLQHLRCFEDGQGRLNQSILDIHGQVLVVSNFTLFGDCRKGRRPSLDKAAGSEVASGLYLQVVEQLRQAGLQVQTGLFGEHMEVGSINDGPINLLLDSKKAF